MWLSNQSAAREWVSEPVQRGSISIEGAAPAVLLEGERRGCLVAAFGGLRWAPALGSEVLTLRDAEGDCWIIGTEAQGEAPAPGELKLESPWGCISLCSGGIVLRSALGRLSLGEQGIRAESGGTVLSLDGSGLSFSGELRLEGSASLNGMPLATAEQSGGEGA